MKMTWKKLTNMIEQGYGQGHGNNYKPFLHITRRNTSQKSNQSAGTWLPGYTRAFDYFSRTERLVALAITWLGAKDVREQFPMWPVAHQHPLEGAPGTETTGFSDVPGLMELAKQAGIDHGVFPGTRLPYVATIDLMATVRSNNECRLVAIPCKPREIITNADAASRVLERLELERIYCDTVGLRRCVADVEGFGKELLANLEWMMPDTSTALRLQTNPELYNFRDRLRHRIHDTPIDRIVQEASTEQGWPLTEGNSAFRFLAWHQEIDIDLSVPVILTQPARRGGIRLRDALRKNILGEIDYEQL